MSDELETITAKPGNTEGIGPGTWWQKYNVALSLRGFSNITRSVVEADSRYIYTSGILGDGAPGMSDWPESRVRRGLVMGAVQSGKTASMIGVSAVALDADVDVVVVLAGTRVALWRQTYERFTRDLGLTTGTLAEQLQNRILRPEPTAVLFGQEAGALYAITRPSFERALRKRIPLVVVLMKQVQHLRHFGEVVRTALVPAADQAGRPVHMLVLDDEADDGSVLDSRVEASLDPSVAELKQIPRAIADLWSVRDREGESASRNLFVNYVGYTATPQANFLQDDFNPLAPRDFVAALRVPSDTGYVLPRLPTYKAPDGPSAYYTGGQVFYGDGLGSVLETDSMAQNEILPSALRAFLVGVTIRLLRAKSTRSLTACRSDRFATAKEAETLSPSPSCMLVHPSQATASHFASAAEILAWGRGLDPFAAESEYAAGVDYFDVDAVQADFNEAPDEWRGWYDEYRFSESVFRDKYPPITPVKNLPSWQDVQDLLFSDVVPNLRLSTINSDPRADDRPQFEPIELADKTWTAAPDLLTVFVSGNVMSRGLTLEGLLTTVFTRTASAPAADTQMQMQRWFGYRGSYAYLCKVFASGAQSRLFSAYHENDNALRSTVIAAMTDGAKAPSPIVLQGSNFVATSKIAGLTTSPLSPGAGPFVRHMNSGAQQDPNAAIVGDLFRRSHSPVVAAGTLRGRILDTPLTLGEATDVLQSLRYESGVSWSTEWSSRQWAWAQAILSATGDPFGQPLFMPPTDSAGPVPTGANPYEVAAYLRFWRACLTRRVNGIFATDNPNQGWSLLDLEARRSSQPKFYIGIRFGGGDAVHDRFINDIGFEIPMMERAVVGDALDGSWGSRVVQPTVGEYFGDDLFDFHFHGSTPPQAVSGQTRWRDVGSPGLILFNFVKRASGNPTVAVGIALPLGGPNQFAARAPGVRR